MLDLDMSPYAAFVWPAWGVSALVLAALTARALIAGRRWKRELDRLEGAAGPRDGAQAARSAVAPKESPQAAQSAVGRKDSPQAARSAVGPKE